MIRISLILIFALTLIPISPSTAQTTERTAFSAGNIDQLALVGAISELSEESSWLETYWFDDSGDYLLLVFEDYIDRDISRYGTTVVNMTTLERHRLPMSDVIPVMVGEQVAIASDGQLVLWNYMENTQVASLGRFDGDLQQGPGCLMWYDGTHYQIADGTTGETIGQVETTISPFSDFGFSDDCTRVAMLDTYDDVLLLWDAQTNAVINVLSPTRYVLAPNYPLSFSADNRYFAWRSEGDKLTVYDFETDSYTDLNRASYSRFAATFRGNTLVTFEYNYRDPFPVQFWRDGETVYYESMLDIAFRDDFILMLTPENALELWDGDEQIDTIEGLPFAGDLVISPQANLVGVADGQRYWLYDRRTGGIINTTTYSYVYSDDITFSADETLYILPDGTNDRLRIHSIATGEQLAWVTGSYSSLSPDGSTLVLNYRFDGGVILYGIAEGRTTQPALLGETVANIISLRDQPLFNSSENGIAEGMLYIVGRSADNQFVYDANADGWVRAGNAYVELFGRLDHLPVIEAAPAWVSAPVPERPMLASVPVESQPIEESETDFEIASTVDVNAPPQMTTENAADVRLLSVIEGGPFAAGSGYLATGNGSTLLLWDLWTLEEVGSFDFGEDVFVSRIQEVVTSGDMVVIRFTTGGGNNDYHFAAWRAGQELNILNTGYQASFAVQDNRLFYPHVNSANVSVFDMWTMQPITTLPGLRDYVRHLELSPDGRWLVASDGSQYDDTRSVNRRVLVWDTFNDFELVHTFENFTDGVTHISFSDDSRYLTVSGTGFRVWDLIESEHVLNAEQRMLYGYVTGYWAYAFSTDSDILNVWDLTTGEFHTTLNNIGAAYYFPDGDTLLIARNAPYSREVWEYPQTWQTWRISTQEVLSNTDFSGYYSEFVADGDALVTYTDTALRVWDLRDPTRLTLSARLDEPDAHFVAVHDARESLLVVNHNNEVTVVPLNNDANTVFPLHFYRRAGQIAPPVSLWLTDGETIDAQPISTGYTDPALGYLQETIYLEGNQDLPYFDGSTIIMPVYGNILIFGIPTESRPAWQPVTGQVVPSAIQVKAEPQSDAQVLQHISGEIGIGGVYGSEGRTAFYYVPEVNGWVNGDTLFVTVDEPLPRFAINWDE